MATNKPKVGSTVEIKIVNTSATLHGPFKDSTPRFYTLRGVVHALPEWERDPNMICLVIPGDDIPLRLIHMSRVISINGVHHQMVDHEREVHHVQGSKGANYIVTHEGNKWSCSCAGFGFRKSCKHVEAISQEKK